VVKDCAGRALDRQCRTLKVRELLVCGKTAYGMPSQARLGRLRE
jgi:hypothetical protein